MEHLKSSPVFPEGMLQTEIRVPLLQVKVFRPAWPLFGSLCTAAPYLKPYLPIYLFFGK